LKKKGLLPAKEKKGVKKKRSSPKTPLGKLCLRKKGSTAGKGGHFLYWKRIRGPLGEGGHSGRRLFRSEKGKTPHAGTIISPKIGRRGIQKVFGFFSGEGGGTRLKLVNFGVRRKHIPWEGGHISKSGPRDN